MSINPFTASAADAARQQQMRRERVKVTFYTVLGCMILLCLGLLFQGCRNHQPGTENPLNAAQTSMNSQIAVATPAGDYTSDTAPAVSKTHSPAADSSDSEMAYQVKSGDSLSKIAKAHRTTVQAIKIANDLASERLIVGQKLKIPANT